MNVKQLLPSVVLAAAVVGSSLAPPPIHAFAPEDRSETTPTGWYWYHGISPEFITQEINAKGLRIIDLEVETLSPLRFSVAFVRNAGVYAKGWWWYYGLTAQQVTERINAHQARITDINPYEAGGSTRFAVVMVPNTGADAKTWWWYHGVSTQYIWARHQENGARLVDLERYTIGGSEKWACVMVRNAGSDASGWWWYHGFTASQVSAEIQSKRARIADIETYFVDGQQRFAVILLPNTGAQGIRWWWYYGVTAGGLMEYAAQNGARIVDIETYVAGGSKRFAALLSNNANDLTSRLGGLLGYGSDGATGVYLKRVDGSVLASLQPDFVFEPASTIKALPHLYAMLEVQAGNATLDELINYCATMTGSCPVNPPCNGPDRQLTWLLQQMMWMSDNPATDAVIRRFGRNAINSLADSLGMSLTQINHTLGCGGPTPNQLTLRDIGRLYEHVAGGILVDDLRDTFYRLMSGKDASYADGTIDFTGAWGSISRIIDEEAASLGVPTSAREAFKRQARFANKAGGYELNGRFYVSQAGWISLPVCQSGVTRAREYVFSFFMHGAQNKGFVDSRFATLRGEVLREQIRDALDDFESPCGSTDGSAFFVRGDANLDRTIDLSDGIRVLEFLFLGGATPGCMDAADVNDSGAVNVSDASALFSFLYLGGSTPPGAPSGVYQQDRTADSLDCDAYPEPRARPVAGPVAPGPVVAGPIAVQ